MALTQQKYYNKYLNPAKSFSNKIYDKIREKGIDIHNRERIVNEFMDDNGDEWTISSDYVLGIFEMRIICKTSIQDKPKYICGWAYREDECRNKDTYHFIPVNNLRFHIERTKNLIQKYK